MKFSTQTFVQHNQCLKFLLTCFAVLIGLNNYAQTPK